MKKILEKAKDNFLKTIKDKNLYIFFFISLLFFGIFCAEQKALDTYDVFSYDPSRITGHFASCGRFVTAGANALLQGLLRLGDTTVYYLSYGFALICTVLSMYVFNNVIKKDVKNDFVSMLISTLVIINPFSLELFIYIEKGIMMLSVLLCVMAFKQIADFFEKKDKKSILFAGLLMFIANCCYQGTVGIFVVLSLVYILKYTKSIKDFILNNIIVAFTYGIPTVLNFVLIKIFYSNGRVDGSIVLSESIKKVFGGIVEIFEGSYGLLPKYTFSIGIVILVATAIYKIIKDKLTLKQSALVIGSLLYIILVATLVTVAPQLCQATESIWFVPRSSYPVAALIGILMLYLFTNFEIKDKLKNFVAAVGIVLLSMQLFLFIRHSINIFIVNYEDKQIITQILDFIDEYEEKTGIDVNKVAIYSDKNKSWTYQGIITVKDMNTKAFASDWALLSLLRYYSGEDYIEIEKDPLIEQNFSRRNWDYYSDQQLVIKDDVVHICNY